MLSSVRIGNDSFGRLHALRAFGEALGETQFPGILTSASDVCDVVQAG